MTGVPDSHLAALYRDTDDPWNFRTSVYESERFHAVLASLPDARLRSILEIGCGNGELARQLVPRCASYTGLDAAEPALSAARKAVPSARFVKGFLPCPLPDGDHDLILLSEILYFLDPGGITDLALEIDARWPTACLVCVNYRGPSGNLVECEAALALFLASLDTRRTLRTVHLDPTFRIDLAGPGDLRCGAIQ